MVISYLLRANYPNLIIKSMSWFDFKTLITPDFGASDIWHQYLPYKFFLSQSLKQGHLPLWCHQIGNGLPILAQGQMGAFNLINLILFGLFPFPLAVNLFYLACLLTALLGAYLLVLSLRFKKLTATFFALSFTFSGFMIAHLSHWDILQAASLLPLTFLLLNQFLEKKNYKYLLGLSFVLSQQLFTGASQIVFINFTGLLIFLLLKRSQPSFLLKDLLFFLLSILFSFSLSAIQLLPSWEYINYSIRSQGLNFDEVTRFPYPLKHVFTFWQPFLFGHPKDGTYPLFSEKWGIFWENTAYFGKIALILSLLGLFIKPKNKNKQGLKKTSLIILVFSFLLVLGKNSPFYFIFTFFPFNLFRVPSRFLLLVLFSLLILASLALESLRKRLKKISLVLVSSLILINLFDLGYHFLNYHPRQDFNRWLSLPPTAEFLIKNQVQEKIFSLGKREAWNQIFVNQGWQEEEESFHYLRNSLDPNLNLLFNLKQLGEHNSIPLRRQQFLETILFSYLSLNEDEQTITVEKPALKILVLNHVKYLISSLEINSENLKEVYQVKPGSDNLENSRSELPVFRIYQLDSFLPFARIVFDYQLAKSISGFHQLLNQETFDEQKTVILENKLEEELGQETDSQINILKNEAGEIILDIFISQQGILTLADSYYPGWQATVDGQKTKIFPANLNQKALFIPAGQHRVEVFYKPKAFYWGAIISLIAYLIFIYLVIRPKKSFFPESANIGPQTS